MLEERVASLEGGRAAVAAASGHAAQFLVFATMMEQGDEFLASRNLYGGSLTQFGLSFIAVTFDDFLDHGAEYLRRDLGNLCISQLQ